ncbi:uncharacterized protein LOC143486129 [Brachyhypopomus gauderio]|uniref:uncharacterized protein LOC143486129 n=1 Tax=Brachyhypopomus gauderio TaxID=698409 RepID=UPI0040427B8A
MKILIILPIYLNLGLVSCLYVMTGYSGGSLMITCRNSEYGMSAKYFCKVKSKNECENMIYAQTQEQKIWTQNGRMYLFDDSHQALTVLYRQIRSQDSGTYRCGENALWSVDFKLKVIPDQCCMDTNTMNINSGKIITIDSYYPAKYEQKTKLFFKLVDRPTGEVIRTLGQVSHEGRFSMSDVRSAKLLNVNISDVRDDDGGVYFYGVWNRGVDVSYYTLFKEILIHVTANTHTTKTPESTTETHQTERSTTERPDINTHNALCVAILVCVCVILLLIGGLAMKLYKMKNSKTQASFRTQLGRNQLMDNESRPSENQLEMSTQPVSLIPNPYNNQSRSVYQNLEPNTNQSHSAYHSLDPNANQSHSMYQSLDSNANQSHSMYQSVAPNTNQSHSIYQSLAPNANQSHSIYQSLDPNTIHSNSTYQHLVPNTNHTYLAFQNHYYRA